MELLKLQQQINSMQNNKRQLAKNHGIDLSELGSDIPQFSGDDHYNVAKWFAQFNDYTKMCEYSDKEKCVGVHRRLTPTAKTYAV